MSGKRFLVATCALATSLSGIVAIACGDDDDRSTAAPGDGDAIAPGGPDGAAVAPIVDGGVVYFDGGLFVPYDAGPSACSETATAATPFGPGLYGCGGRVAFPERTSLCRSDCRACTAEEWRSRRAPQSVPARNYWLADSLRHGSGPTCNATTGNGVVCGAAISYTPMRVCADVTADPEGNQCNYQRCGYEVRTNQHFGGCANNVSARTVCCPNGLPAPSGCAAGADTETFDDGMAGCAGTVPWTERATLCASSYHPCSAGEWLAHGAGGDAGPLHHYWVEDLLNWSGANGDCAVSRTNGIECSAYDTETTTPMRVCGAGTAPDPDGNRCAVAGCDLEAPGVGGFMGGCFADGGTRPAAEPPDAGYETAGTVCCCDG